VVGSVVNKAVGVVVRVEDGLVLGSLDGNVVRNEVGKYEGSVLNEAVGLGVGVEVG
jgi:hypothetical protein